MSWKHREAKWEARDVRADMRSMEGPSVGYADMTIETRRSRAQPSVAFAVVRVGDSSRTGCLDVSTVGYMRAQGATVGELQ